MKTEAQIKEAIAALRKAHGAPLLTKGKREDVRKSIALLEWVLK